MVHQTGNLKRRLLWHFIRLALPDYLFQVDYKISFFWISFHRISNEIIVFAFLFFFFPLSFARKLLAYHQHFCIDSHFQYLRELPINCNIMHHLNFNSFFWYIFLIFDYLNCFLPYQDILAYDSRNFWIFYQIASYLYH
jgi:hypothetical protein